MARTPNILRSLRSTSSGDDDIKDKYNFDVEEFEIPPTRLLKVLSRGLPMKNETIEKQLQIGQGNGEPDLLNGLQDKTEAIASMILDIEKHSVKGMNCKNTEDLLPDCLYSAFHKKMLKQENRMLESELAQGENEAERLHLLYEKLDMVTWLTTLRKVTVIANPNDENEVLRKKEQTQQYIKSLLDKFVVMKKRCNVLARSYKTGKINPSREWPKLYKKIDRRLIMNYHSSSDEDEEAMNAEDIRKYRREKRRKQCRGSLIIQLTMSSHAPLTRFAIIADPLSSPYVVKVSKDERRSWNKMMEGEPAKFKTQKRLPNQIAVPKRRISLQLSFERKQNSPGNESNKLTNNDCAPLVRISIVKEKSELKDRENNLHSKKHIMSSFDANIRSPPIRRKKRKQD